MFLWSIAAGVLYAEEIFRGTVVTAIWGPMFLMFFKALQRYGLLVLAFAMLACPVFAE